MDADSIATAEDQLDLSLPLPNVALIKRALAGEVRFRNDRGGTASLSITQASEGHYTLTLDGTAVPIQIDKGLPPEEALARIADYTSQLPSHMRDGVSEIEVSKKESASMCLGRPCSGAEPMVQIPSRKARRSLPILFNLQQRTLGDMFADSLSDGASVRNGFRW